MSKTKNDDANTEELVLEYSRVLKLNIELEDKNKRLHLEIGAYEKNYSNLELRLDAVKACVLEQQTLNKV